MHCIRNYLYHTTKPGNSEAKWTDLKKKNTVIMSLVENIKHIHLVNPKQNTQYDITSIMMLLHPRFIMIKMWLISDEFWITINIFKVLQGINIHWYNTIVNFQLLSFYFSHLNSVFSNSHYQTFLNSIISPANTEHHILLLSYNFSIILLCFKDTSWLLPQYPVTTLSYLYGQDNGILFSF